MDSKYFGVGILPPCSPALTSVGTHMLESHENCCIVSFTLSELAKYRLRLQILVGHAGSQDASDYTMLPNQSYTVCN